MSLEGMLLTTIGFFIFVIGALLMMIASRKETVCEPLWENEQVFYERPRYHRVSGGEKVVIQYPRYVFSLQYPSLVKGEIFSTKGPYTFYIHEYFGPHITPEELSKPKVCYKQRTTAAQKESFELILSPGCYGISFLDTTLLEAKFSITECHDIKPYEKWFGLGQTLWEVGIPVLITGLVLLLLIP